MTMWEILQGYFMTLVLFAFIPDAIENDFLREAITTLTDCFKSFNAEFELLIFLKKIDTTLILCRYTLHFVFLLCFAANF